MYCLPWNAEVYNYVQKSTTEKEGRAGKSLNCQREVLIQARLWKGGSLKSSDAYWTCQALFMPKYKVLKVGWKWIVVEQMFCEEQTLKSNPQYWRRQPYNDILKYWLWLPLMRTSYSFYLMSTVSEQNIWAKLKSAWVMWSATQDKNPSLWWCIIIFKTGADVSMIFSLAVSGLKQNNPDNMDAMKQLAYTSRHQLASMMLKKAFITL